MITKAEMYFVPTSTDNKFHIFFSAKAQFFFVALTFWIKFLISAKLSSKSGTSNNNKVK